MRSASTVRRNARPNVTPLVGVWSDDTFVFCTGPTEKKAHNLEHHSGVAVTTGVKTWQDGLDVVVDCTAERVTGHATLTELADAYRAKYGDDWDFDCDDEVFDPEGNRAYVYRVHAVKVIAFAKARHGQTTIRPPGVLSLRDTSWVSGAGVRRNLTDTWLPVALLILAGVGWWWSVISANGMVAGDEMSMAPMPAMSFAAFLVAWVAMMAAMMLPAMLPVVRLYARAAAVGNAAPVAVFVAGYLALWSAAGIPAFFAWDRLSGPLAHGDLWVGRLAGAVALATGVYQLTPLKSICLRHCRSPLSFFLHHGRHLDRPVGAFVAGGRHGLFCLGCCWMLMVLLIAFGTMQLAWMVALAVLILLEKTAPFGEWVSRGAAVVFSILGVVLLVNPMLVTHLV